MIKTITSLRTVCTRHIDLLREDISWEVFDDLEAIIDAIYEEQQRGRNPDLEYLKLLNKSFLRVWGDFHKLDEIHKNHPVLQHNQKVLLLCVMVLWGASFTINDFPKAA